MSFYFTTWIVHFTLFLYYIYMPRSYGFRQRSFTLNQDRMLNYDRLRAESKRVYFPLKFPVQIWVRIIGSKTVKILMQVYDPIIQLVFRPFFAFRSTHVIFRSMNL